MRTRPQQTCAVPAATPGGAWLPCGNREHHGSHREQVLCHPVIIATSHLLTWDHARTLESALHMNTASPRHQQSYSGYVCGSRSHAPHEVVVDGHDNWTVIFANDSCARARRVRKLARGTARALDSAFACRCAAAGVVPRSSYTSTRRARARDGIWSRPAAFHCHRLARRTWREGARHNRRTRDCQRGGFCRGSTVLCSRSCRVKHAAARQPECQDWQGTSRGGKASTLWLPSHMCCARHLGMRCISDHRSQWCRTPRSVERVLHVDAASPACRRQGTQAVARATHGQFCGSSRTGYTQDART